MSQHRLYNLVLLLFFSALSTVSTFAAGHGVGVTLIDYTLSQESSIDLGYTITINAQVTNFDSTEFTGRIDFGLRNSTQVLTTAGIFGQPNYSGETISLHGYETVPAVFSVKLDPIYFRPGPDVVVVWPICTPTTGDSILIHLNVADPNGIENGQDNMFSYVVMSDRILVKNADNKTYFRHVRISNLLGQQVVEQNAEDISTINLPAMQHGIYLMELITADNRRKIVKFLY